MGALDIAVTFVVLLSGSGAATLLVRSATADRAGTPAPSESSSPILSVSPSEELVPAGNTTTLSATWSGPPPGCTDSPLWFRWDLAGGFAEGVLGLASQPTVNFTSDAEGSGATIVEARSELLLACGASLQPILQTASATISVVAPLELENLTISPDSIPAGSTSNLSAIVANGDPPYLVHISWGDGTSSNVSDPAAGPISIGHRFPAGWFLPRILVEDSQGASIEGVVDAPLSANTGPSVGILPRTTEAEVGVPIVFSITTLHPPTSYDLVAECAEPPVQSWILDLLAPGARTFNCTFPDPGTAIIELHLEAASGGNRTFAAARLSEPVAAHLRLTVGPPPESSEPDLASAVTTNVSGGVAPYTITWGLLGNSSWQELTVYSDGPLDLPFWPEEPGAYPISIRVLDAAGETETTVTAPIPVDGPLAVNTTVSRTLGSAGVVVSVAGNISGGSPTVVWCIVPTDDPLSGAVGVGTATSVESFIWNGTFEQSGTITISVVVVDGGGRTWMETAIVSLVPPMNVTGRVFEVANNSGRFLDLNLTTSGGVPPFRVNLSATNGEQWTVFAPSDGTFAWSFPTNASGPIGVLLEVSDSQAHVWTLTENLEIPPLNNSSGPPPSPPSGAPPSRVAGTNHGPSADWLEGLGITFVAAILGLGLLLRWRRGRPATDPAPKADPVAIVRRIVEPAEGAERSTVELLAEEAGIPFEQARATIDRLIAEGTLRAETGEDGEEVLAWSQTP